MKAEHAAFGCQSDVLSYRIPTGIQQPAPPLWSKNIASTLRTEACFVLRAGHPTSVLFGNKKENHWSLPNTVKYCVSSLDKFIGIICSDMHV